MILLPAMISDLTWPQLILVMLSQPEVQKIGFVTIGVLAFVIILLLLWEEWKKWEP